MSQTMMKDGNEPSISVREYIKWLPNKPSEPTSTLVLTSAARRYIDIRIYKPENGSHELPNKGGPLHSLEWAFAGTSSTIIPPGSKVPHSTWIHWLDSATDEPVTDEGDMYPQPDGKVLERGKMVNPATGKMTAYEECWRDEDPVATSSIATTAVSDEVKKKRWSVVLVLDDAENGVKGMVVRVGQYCQGIIKVQGEISLERWEWTEEGGWKRITKLGRMFLPCALAFEEGRVIEGSQVTYGDYKWEVTEVFGW